jgi:hypothetical protein
MAWIKHYGHVESWYVNCAREYFAADVPEPPVSDGAEGLPRYPGSLGKGLYPGKPTRDRRGAAMLDIEHIDHISDEMRAVVESEWPRLACKLPPKKPQG